jgi:type VI secretion system protein ImpM
MPGPEVTGARCAGLYGKLPARGDFLSRRLDNAFVQDWDGWLQRVTAASRERLGAQWLEHFLAAPVWRFVLPAGMFAKSAWVGLMVPSVDRVGRYFPLTLAAPLGEESIDAAATLAKAEPWLNSLEDLALQALAPDLDVERFDAELMQAALPEDLPVPLAVADDTVPLGAPEAAFIVWSTPADASPETSAEQLLQEAMIGRRAASAAWMTHGGETVAASVAMCGGFISGTQYCAMLDGRWSEHAWTVAARESYCDPLLRGVDFIGAPGKSAEDPQSSAIPSREERTAMDTKSE